VILDLRNGQRRAGILTVTFEDDFNKQLDEVLKIRFVPEGETVEEKIDIKDVVGYSYRNNYYAVENLYLFNDQRFHSLFAKKLTGDSSKIQLYELYQSGRGNVTGEEVYSYYISIGKSGETIFTRGEQLMPNFEVKMSSFVEDCPELAQKIRNKQSGYFLPFVSFNAFKPREVLTRIINEYNHCGQHSHDDRSNSR
jgi:hypothetical protein